MVCHCVENCFERFHQLGLYTCEDVRIFMDENPETFVDYIPEMCVDCLYVCEDMDFFEMFQIHQQRRRRLPEFVAAPGKIYGYFKNT